MKSFKSEITVKKLERLYNSYCGNPAWRVGFITEDGSQKIGRTASNASCAYILDWSSKGKRYLCEYHYTKNDNLIITELQELKEEQNMTKKERMEIMLDMICAAIQKKDYEALKVLFCGYCHLVGYNYSEGMMTGGILPDELYRGLVADYCNGVGLFDWR